MTRSKAPPPIKPVANVPHGKWGDAAKHLKRAVDTPPPGMSDVRLQFSDEFSPSHAQAYSNDPQALSNPAARHLFYNQQLYELLRSAIDGAITLGMPPIDVGFPLTFDRITKETFELILRIANGLSPYLEEGSPSWLCVQIYLRHAQICNQLKDPLTREVGALPGESAEELAFRQRGCDAMLLVSYAFFLGAATRELELSILNRRDALRGKKTVRSAQAGGIARKSTVGPDTDRRIEAMRTYVAAGQSVTNAARLAALKIGGTDEANRQLWKRHCKKVGT